MAGSQLFPLPFRNVGKKGSNMSIVGYPQRKFPRSTIKFSGFIVLSFFKPSPCLKLFFNGEVLSAPTCPAGFARGNTLRGCAWDGLEVDRQNT